MMKATYHGIESVSGDEVVVVATPHFRHDWELKRYGKGGDKSLQTLLGTPFPVSNFTRLYDFMAIAPVGTTYYAELRKRAGLKPFAFIYFRNIVNEQRGGRKELELISVTPPYHAQTEGINFDTLHFHDETEKWCDVNYNL